MSRIDGDQRPGDSAKDPSALIPEATKDRRYDRRMRAEVKDTYYASLQDALGGLIKAYWDGDVWMLHLGSSVRPDISEPHRLQLICNKSTMIYWETSAQEDERFGFHTRVVFASIYKTWFRFHGYQPNIHFGKFFAHPFRITPAGPQIVSDIVKLHANICKKIDSQLSLKQDNRCETMPGRQSQYYHLPALCRALITLLDRRSLPPEHENGYRPKVGHISLDEEVERYTMVLVLTGDQRGLSQVINFDAIKSESLPLNRDDIYGIDPTNVIRVPMKTAIHFITELERREEITLINADEDDYVLVEKSSNIDESNHQAIENKTAMKRNGVLTAFKDADEYADAIFYRSSESEWKMNQIKLAHRCLRSDDDEDERTPEDDIVVHWNQSWR